MVENKKGLDSHVDEKALAVRAVDSGSTTAEAQLAEKKLMWKIDCLILPILFIFYFLAYLDRINIGNARIEGMNEELDLDVENRYNVALFVRCLHGKKPQNYS
jgi:hypothetical protein